MRHVFILIAKELFIHRLELSISTAGISGIAIFAFQMRSPETYTQGLVIISMLNVALMMASTEWLSYMERAKGTFLWLRTLPVSDKAVVTAKFVTNGIILTCCYLSAVLILNLHVAVERLLPVIAFWLGLLSLGSFMLFTKLVLSRRLGPSVPLMVVFVLMMGWRALSTRAPHAASMVSSFLSNPFVFITLEVLSILSFWYMMWIWIASRDTHKLID